MITIYYKEKEIKNYTTLHTTQTIDDFNRFKSVSTKRSYFNLIIAIPEQSGNNTNILYRYQFMNETHCQKTVLWYQLEILG